MKCVICKHGQTRAGTTTLTLERDTVTLVVKGVPACVCENCGEAYLDAQVTDEVLEMLNRAVARGVQVEVRFYDRAQVS